MKKSYLLTALFLICSLSLTACNFSSAGPNSWLDRPLDQTHHPLEPIEIMAHASSNTGVASFDISIDGESFHESSVNNGRLEKTTYVWTPEEPGVYTVGVIATDSNGNVGDQATSIIYIGGAGQRGVNNVIGDCEGVEGMHLIANPFSIAPGECSIIYWEVFAPEEWPVFIDNKQVDPTGELPYCIHDSTTVELSVETSTGICKTWEIIDVDEFQTAEEPPLDMTVLFEGNPQKIHRGECSMLFWEIYPPEGGETLLQGDEVPFTGEMEVCPDEPTLYELIAVRFNEERISQVLIDLFEDDPTDSSTPSITPDSILTRTAVPSGDSTATAKPPEGPTNTPSPDTTPPQITNGSVSPNDFIYNTNGSCSPTAFRFSVKITDTGGVANVKISWSGSGVRSGTESMNYSGGKYVKNLGLFANTGSLSNFSITATDNSGNSSTKSFGWNLDVEECGGGS